MKTPCRRVTETFAESQDRLLEIAEDGRIDEYERPEFDAIVDELGEIVKAAMQLRYAQGGDNNVVS